MPASTRGPCRAPNATCWPAPDEMGVHAGRTEQLSHVVPGQHQAAQPGRITAPAREGARRDARHCVQPGIADRVDTGTHPGDDDGHGGGIST
jgi:hypothetical protein